MLKVKKRRKKKMTQELLIECIGCAAQCGKTELVTTLTDILNDMQHPVEKKTRAANNKSGYIQLDMETGKKVAEYATVKEANTAMGKKPTASCISQACRNFKVGKSNVAYGFKWQYGCDFDA